MIARSTTLNLKKLTDDSEENSIMQSAIEAQNQANRLNEAVAYREIRAKRFEEGLEVDVEVLREREIAFAEKVKNFQNALNALLKDL
jgi:hypothetical protein|tara:strand:- start:204 stop:464 length:261 start_codon:yes stop_codon:yes gene_type:complete